LSGYKRVGRIGIVLRILVENGHVGNDSWTERGWSTSCSEILMSRLQY
jgi:hypothetical protein